MAVKKKRTAKQIAATKKLVAANKKRAAKKRAKTVGTSQTKKSQATGKTPSKRLKKRRAKNTRAGYYPNPISTHYYVVEVIKDKPANYFTGTGFTKEKKKAAVWLDKTIAMNIAQDLSGYYPRKNFALLVDEKK